MALRDTPFYLQTELLCRIFPFMKEKDIALKGGTAINLFLRDLPRVSVDLDLQALFESEFVGMTLIPVTIEELLKTRTTLFEMLPAILTEQERLFLLSIKKGEPCWDLIDVSGIENLPALQWKLRNIASMDNKKHRIQLGKLECALGV